MPNLGTRRKRDAAIFPENEKVRVQKKTWKYCLRVAAIITKKKIATPTFIDVASALKIDI